MQAVVRPPTTQRIPAIAACTWPDLSGTVSSRMSGSSPRGGPVRTGARR